MIAWLEWGIASTGVLAFALALWSWHEALHELRAVRLARVNGRYLAAARHHLWRSVFRAIPAVLSFVAGAWLLAAPDDPSTVDLVATACWLVYQVAMIANLGIEWWARERMQEGRTSWG